eukprot:m.64474 g.64474  ORF g.64474 m.64474 type:complete len:183 (-) comp8227_c0_seq2:2203-2751(-)
MQRVRSALWKVARKIGVPEPLPNPPEYKPTRSFLWGLSRAEKTQRVRQAWTKYRQGWADEFAPPEKDELSEEAWRSAVKDNADAANEIYGDVKGSGNAVREYMLKWVKVYRTTIEQFAEGYREGVSPPPPVTPQHSTPPTIQDPLPPTTEDQPPPTAHDPHPPTAEDPPAPAPHGGGGAGTR